ncbi:MAG: sigma-70 family RNA polymerase sigma factor [Nibricoccus sp.]
MTTDADLLHRYVDEHADDAFSELVQRHLNMVYSAALRRTNSNRHLAEEIAQKVFIDLARKSTALKTHPALAGWLYQTTRYRAVDAVRSEARRQNLKHTLQAMPDEIIPSEAHVDWEKVRPVLDEAMDQLQERDRELVLLRFFHGLTFAEIGEKLRLSENAARMRAERALEKLRGYLSKRGVTSTAAALGALLANQAVAAAPSGLAATITGTALAVGPSSGLTGVATVIFMSKITAPIVSALVATGITAILCTSTAKDLKPELTTLHNENARLLAANTTGAPVATVSAAADEFAAQASAVARAMQDRQTTRSSETTVGASAPRKEVTPRGHSDHGIATPHDAAMTFAYAGDVADPSLMAKLLYFDDTTRAEAQKTLSTMPEAIRLAYPTPEAFYGLCLAAACLEAPPPGADLLERFMEIVETGPGRVATRKKGSNRNTHEYQQTADGWKYVVPAEAVKYAPLNLNSDILAKLSNK